METYAIVLLSFGCFFVFYGTASAILLRAPPLPWTRMYGRFGFTARKIAHRGGSLIGPENTLLTFRRAAQHKHVDLLELDCCITSDGVVIVAHDNHLGRQCHVDVHIHETPFDQLPKMARKIDLHFPSPTVDAYHMSEEDFNEHGLQPFVPLKDLFEALPGVPMHVDCKQPSEALVNEVVRLVRAYKRESITVVGAAMNPNAALVQKLKSPPTDSILGGQELLTFACAKDVAKAYIFYYLGFLPLIPVDFDVFDIPLPTTHLKNRFNRPVLTWLLTTPKLWAHLQRRGIRVYGFVLNSPEEVDEAREWPIDGIMTDDPNIFEASPY